jgi:hypothetical protein
MKGKHVMVIGAGGSLREYRDKILKYIEDNNIVTIGINCMTSMCVPDYHLWTNTQRFRDQNSCISEKSKMLFGCGLSKDLIRKHYKGEYEVIDYDGRSQSFVSYEDGKIKGNFRTAGILAIMVVHVKGAKKIDIVGMDGFTLYSKKDLDKKKHNQHCYGSGHTDDAIWEQDLKKDELVYDGLRALEKYGINFRILTPTKFEYFYDPKELQ